MSDDVTDPLICELLHEASLEALAWRPELGELVLSFHPLRKGPDGSDPEEPIVDWVLCEVSRVVVLWEVGMVMDRPSEHPLPAPDSLIGLRGLEQATEAWASLEPPQDGDPEARAVRVDRLFGDARHDDVHRLSLSLPSIARRAEAELVVSFSRSRLESGGVPFGMEQWEQEYGAWWESWGEYWERQKAGAEGDDPSEAATFIPVGENPPRDPNTYVPSEPPWLVEDSALPSQMLRVLEAATQEAFECAHTALAGGPERWDSDQFFFARAIGSAWIEGTCAGVDVHGVAFSPADEEDPALLVMGHRMYALRLVGGAWEVHKTACGWLSKEDVEPGRHDGWRNAWPEGPPPYREDVDLGD